MNAPQPTDEVALCKGCNTIKHLDSNGLCGRCQPNDKPSCYCMCHQLTSSRPSCEHCQPNDEALRAQIGRLVHGDYHAVHGWDTPLVNSLLDIFAHHTKAAVLAGQAYALQELVLSSDVSQPLERRLGEMLRIIQAEQATLKGDKQ